MGIKVKAIAPGFYANILRDPNDPGLEKFLEFEIQNESEFCAEWMAKIEEAPVAAKPAAKTKAPAEEPIA